MKLLVGLGNPGQKYKKNRHNLGHMFVDWAKKESSFSKERFFIKTDCFMNDSGEFMRKKFGGFGGFGDLYIVHDDLDLPLGAYKIQFGKGPQLHYGLQSVEKELGTKDFWRVRVGVDNRNLNNRTAGEEYVLQDFTQEERRILDEEIFPKIKDELEQRLAARKVFRARPL